jgi:tetratricopeptide (TPR) repeat protein
MTMSRLVIVLLVVGWTVSAASADEREQAGGHARRAVALYDLGRYEAALDEFTRAYALYPTDTLLFNLAQTHRKLEHCREATELYKVLLDRYPASERGPAVRRLLPALEAACAVKDQAPRGVGMEAAGASPAAVTASAPPAPPHRVAIAPPATPDPAINPGEGNGQNATGGVSGAAVAATGEPAAPAAAAPDTRLYAAVTAGALSASDGQVTPFGVTVGASRRMARLPVEPGVQVGAAGHAWSGEGYRGSSSTIGVLVTAGRAMRRPTFDLRVDAGAGATVLTGITTGHPLLARGRRVASGTATVPQLELVASAERRLGGAWRLMGGARVGAALGGDTFGGAMLSFTALVGIGRGL